MRYVIATFIALSAAVLLGLAGGLIEATRTVLPPEHKATFLAFGISCAMNTTAFFVLVLVPAATGIAYWGARRRARRGDLGRRGRAPDPE